MNVFVRGLPNVITVDENVPTSIYTALPIFTGINKDGAIWAPILEKVWAKLNGNYERTEIG